MQISVLIEPLDGGAFRVRGFDPFGFIVEASTRDEALELYRRRVIQQLTTGAEVVQLDVGDTERPWVKFRGRWAADDPVIDEWQNCVEEYRRQVETDPNV